MDLTVDLFERRYGINGPARRVSRELFLLLTRVEPGSPLEDRSVWLQELLEWILALQPGFDLYGAEGIEDTRTARLTFLLAALSMEPELGDRVRSVITSLFEEGSIVRLLCSTGLPSAAGFFGELSSRLALNLLPQAPEPKDLSRPLLRAFRQANDVAWLQSELDAPRLGALCAVLFSEQAQSRMEAQRQQALATVSTRVAALGLAEDFLARGSDASPFLELSSGLGRRADAAEIVSRCRQACLGVRAHLEEFGVSTDIVYRLEAIDQGLTRSTALLEVDLSRSAGLLVSVLGDAHTQKSLSSLVTTSSRQLARKIVERSGSTGDHYITGSRREWFGMLLSAGGGGVLTTGTTFLKYVVGWLGLPLLIEGGANSLNYALSFLLMQMLGFTLATKQPSMTAAALARSLEEDLSHGGHEGVVDMIARMVRSQLAAVMGNLGFVIPSCLLADFIYRHLKGHSFFDAYAAEHVVHALNPSHGGTLFHAALTGVLLWVSSIAAGWLDNWVAYRRLPDAVAHHPGLRAVLGQRTAGWMGRTLGRAASGFAGCVSLGVLLGLVPLTSKLFGLPLDVRHVTLSTGGLTLAFRGLGLEGFVEAGGLAALGGIALIGALNFGVSFACALAVAMRARDIDWRDHLRLAVALLKGFVRSPARFLFPPRGAAPAHAPHPEADAALQLDLDGGGG